MDHFDSNSGELATPSPNDLTAALGRMSRLAALCLSNTMLPGAPAGLASCPTTSLTYLNLVNMGCVGLGVGLLRRRDPEGGGGVRRRGVHATRCGRSDALAHLASHHRANPHPTPTYTSTSMRPDAVLARCWVPAATPAATPVARRPPPAPAAAFALACARTYAMHARMALFSCQADAAATAAADPHPPPPTAIGPPRATYTHPPPSQPPAGMTATCTCTRSTTN